MARTQTTQEHHDHTGVAWLSLGIAMVAVYLFFILMGTHQDVDTHSPIWFGVLIGGVMIIFGLVGMTKRRHPGHV